MKINKPITITVRDRAGNILQREEGHLLDGDAVLVPMALLDAASGLPASTALAAGRRILGDAFSPADYAGLGDDAARHAIVRRKLGAAADGQPTAFLDAAWRSLATDGLPAAKPAAAAHSFTPAQLAMAQAGIQDALAHHAASTGDMPMQAALDGARAAHGAALSDAWKGPDQAALEKATNGASPEEVLAARSGAYHSMVKPEQRKLSGEQFFALQEKIRAGVVMV